MSNFKAKDLEFIPNMPAGPLDKYRKQASFDWKELKVIIERSIHNVKTLHKAYDLMESDPDYAPSSVILSVDELKRRAALQLKKLSLNSVSLSAGLKKDYHRKFMDLLITRYAMKFVIPDFLVKQGIGCNIVGHFLSNMGTEKHLELSNDSWDSKIIGAVAMTEVESGSNTKCLRTMATYDPQTQEFILNTPDFLAAKCLIGNLGKTCTHALVFAQLYTNDSCYGLHIFMVPIRNPKTMTPYPGILVGDVGDKIGIHGVDNGFMLFKNYRVKRECLLNRISDVSPSGEYIHRVSDPSRILIITFEALFAPRIGISWESLVGLIGSSVIATRYAAIRETVGSYNNKNIPLIDYQLHQSRIFPYLASSVLFKIFAIELANIYFKYKEEAMKKNDIGGSDTLLSELHGIISAVKPLFTWTSVEATIDCREACGGHGYLRASNFGELRNSVEVGTTYEGDNHVLGLQTSNWLLGRYKSHIEDGEPILTPLKTISFIENISNILKTKFIGNCQADVMNEKFIIEAFQWLICSLLTVTYKKIAADVKKGKSKLEATANNQAFRAKVLSRIFADYLVLLMTNDVISNVKGSCKQVLRNLFMLYGLTGIEKYATYFYGGQYTNSPRFVELIHGSIIDLYGKLRPDAIAIADSLAPTDFVLNSILGTADGKVYENIENAYLYGEGNMEKPSWIRDVMPSKL